jgi:signal transduction histidine kinase
MASGKAPKRPDERRPTRSARPPSGSSADRSAELEAARQDLREALEQQTATSDILRVIATSPADVEPVLDAIARSAARVCGASDAHVYRVDGNVLRQAAHFGPIPGLEQSESLPLSRGSVIGRSIVDREAVHIGDAASDLDPSEYPISVELQRRWGYRTTLSVPLLRDNVAIGGIAIRRTEVRPFTPKQIEVLQTFAAQAVIAIENVRLFNETKESLERQTAISEVLDAINSSAFDLEHVLTTMLEKAMQLCAADNGGIVQVEGEAARIVAVAGSPEHVALAREAFRDRQIRRDRGSLTGRVLLAGKTVQIPDMLNDPEYEGITTDRITKVIGGDRTGLGVPLIRSGIVVGAILLRRQRVAPFTAAETSLVEAFAAQAVIAMENARLFNETKEALERQTATSEVLKAISDSAFDLQPMFDQMLTKAVQLCRADYGNLYHRSREGEVVSSVNVPAEIIQRNREATRRLAAAGPNRKTLAARALLEQATVHIPDINLDSDLERPHKVYEELSVRAVLAVPMRRAAEIQGIITLWKKEPGPFSQSAISLVETFADQASIAIENVRLFNETGESLERQTALAEILRVIARSPTDVQPVLDAIAESAARFCAAEDVAVGLMEGELWRIRAHHGPVEIILDPVAIGASGRIGPTFVSGRSMIERRTIHVPDLHAAADEYPEGLAASPTTRAIVATPLLSTTGPIGAIFLRRTEPTPFTEREIELAETFAAQAVIAIENVRLFTETKEALERQTATSEVLRAISGSPTELQPVLDAIAANAARFCRAEDVTVALVDGELLRIRAHVGAIDQVVAEWRLDRDSVTGRAVLEGRTIEVGDLQAADADFPVSARLGREAGHRTILATPLVREGRAIGCIFLRRPEIRPFTPVEIALVETFAAQAVIAIENVRLFNETREKSGQLEAANQELAAASRHKSEFLANMSHELRTPLNAIIGFSDVLEQRLFGELNERQADYTRDIASSGRHLLDLVNEILDLSKVEAGRMDLEPSEFTIADTIQAALAFLRERAANHRITLTDESADDLGTIVADERKVRQVLLNLLSNAVKFTPDGGTINVRARRESAVVEVAVRDTGIGIAPEDQAKVFDEFQQVGKASDRSREGTGLGLTLAKRFIELHGGRIWVESEVGRGTTFTFAIPVGPASPASGVRPGS